MVRREQRRAVSYIGSAALISPGGKCPRGLLAIKQRTSDRRSFRSEVLRTNPVAPIAKKGVKEDYSLTPPSATPAMIYFDNRK